MRTPMNKLAAAIGIGATCMLVVPAVLAEGFELNGAVGHHLFDDDRRLTDEPFWGLGAGYKFNETWTVEGWWMDSNPEFFGTNVDATEARLDALYHLPAENGITPYFVMGLGEMDYDSSLGDVDETRVNLGVGLKKALSDRLSMRGDVRLFNSLDHENTDYALQLGLNYALGKVAPKAPKVVDSDGDGVADGSDACPGTSPGTPVDARGCPLDRDSDGDGVIDSRDKCPETSAILKVDADGCPIKLTKAVSIELKVNFDTNSAVVKPQYMSEIERVVQFMNQYQGTVVEVQGHTDSTGAADYNQNLSQRRADAVAKVMVEQFGVASRRVTSMGYGESRPVSSNDTAAGRADNRRVVAEISTKVETMQKR